MAEEARKAGPVVTEAMVAPLKGALRALLAEGLPAEEVEHTTATLLRRLRAGLQKLRPDTQLAPWMFGVTRRVVGNRRGDGLRQGMGKGDALVSQDRIAGALVPFVEALSPEHAEVLLLTDHGPLSQRQAAERVGVSLVTLKSRVHAARRRLRALVLAGLGLLAAPAPVEASGLETGGDVRAPRRRVPASSLLPAFVGGLEELVRPWVAEGQARAVAVDVVTRLGPGIEGQRVGGVVRGVYAVIREAVRAAASTAAQGEAHRPELERDALASGESWSSRSLSMPLGDRLTLEARATLAPVVRLLTAGALPEQADALALVDLNGCSQRSAARLAGVRPEAFKQRLWRARRLAWARLAGILDSSTHHASSDLTLEALQSCLQALIQNLAPNKPPLLIVQEILRLLRAEPRSQRPTASLVEHLFSLALAALLAPRPARHPIPPTSPGPTELIALTTALAPLLANLTPDQATALTLSDLQGLSLNAAAARVGVDRPTFQGRLQRARVRLHALLRAISLRMPHDQRRRAGQTS